MDEIQGGRHEEDAAINVQLAQLKLESEAVAVVNGGEDPTSWLPDELMIQILVQVVHVEGSRTVKAVCRRWQRLCQDKTVKATASDAQWRLYAEEKRKPRFIAGPEIGVLVASIDGNKVYGSAAEWSLPKDFSIKVWSTTDGSLLQTLTGHGNSVTVLAVGHNGTLYSGSSDWTIRVWCAEKGDHIRTLEGHRNAVDALAVNDAHVFSGADDCTIRVWACATGETVRVISTDDAYPLTVGRQGQLYSGGDDGVISVWSPSSHTLTQSLVGHTDPIAALVVAVDGTLYSADIRASTIRAWSGEDGALLRTMEGSIHPFAFLAVTPNGTLFSRSARGIILVWQFRNGIQEVAHTISTFIRFDCTRVVIPALTGTSRGQLWAVSPSGMLVFG